MEEYNQINIQPLAASTKEKRYLFSCSGKYYEANRPLAELLQCLQQHDSEEEGISCYLRMTEKKYTHAQVAEAIEHYIRPMLHQEKEAGKRKTFLYERELFSAATIDRFSDAFSFLFRKRYMAGMMAITLLLDGYVMLTTDEMLKFNNQINAYTVCGVLVFMLCSSLFHEIGHASACKYFGLRHGGVGFGLYLNFPVLYTDVTEVWKLRRGERCVVNLAGVYFQCFFLLALLLLFLLTRNDMVRYLILSMNFGFLMTLNPFFKFDGYWLASDLLGVPNLRKRSRKLVSYVWQRIRRKKPDRTPYLLQINKLEQICMLFYSVVVNFFMGYYFCYIIPRFLYGFALSFPDEVKQLILYLSNGMTPPFALLRNLAMQLIFLSLVGYMIVNLIRPLKKYVWRRK